nr:hypothetical protein [Paracoccus sp. FO-3]
MARRSNPNAGPSLRHADSRQGEKADQRDEQGLLPLPRVEGTSEPGIVFGAQHRGTEAGFLAPHSGAGIAAGHAQPQQFRMAHHAGENRQHPVAAAGGAGQGREPVRDILGRQRRDGFLAELGEDVPLDAIAMPHQR